jgi:hypothetical protein
VPADNFCDAFAVNEAGQIVGYSQYTVPHVASRPAQAAYWDSSGAVLAIPVGTNSQARSINKNGTIAGFGGAPLGWIYDISSGSLTLLGPLGGTGNSSPRSINDNGDVAGVSNGRAVFWAHDNYAQPVALPTLGGSSVIVFAMNNLGEITGSSTKDSLPGTPAYPVVWLPSAAGYQIVELPHGSARSSTAGTADYGHGINDQGQIAGASANDAMVWQTQPLTVTPLPLVAGVSSFGVANGVNSRGEIVGYRGLNGGSGADTPQGVYWMNGASTPIQLNGIDGGTNSFARAISDGGEIVGFIGTAAGTSAFKVWRILMTCPDPITLECTSPGGAAASFSAAASDGCGAAVSCVPLSGSTFPLGTTSDSCGATDACGNAGSCSFAVTVVDTTPPAFDAASLGDQKVVGNCASSAIPFSASPTPGAVTLPTASDACSSATTVTCAPLSGDSFGDNTVRCTATDASGNQTDASIKVTVLEPLTVAFQSPLRASAVNLVKDGSTVPTKVKLFDCSNVDVTGTAPVTVGIDVALTSGDSCPGGETNPIPITSTGVGDTGGTMALVNDPTQGWVYQFNVSTKGFAVTNNTSSCYLDSASVSYSSSPGYVVDQPVASVVLNTR